MELNKSVPGSRPAGPSPRAAGANPRAAALRNSPERTRSSSLHNSSLDYHKISLEKIARQLDTPDGYIRLSGAIERDSIVNGDGLRAVLWVQGCPNHCPGCQNPETWDYEAGKLVKIEDVLKELAKLPGQDGLTFCGGEPFVQAKACKKIADYVRKELGWNVWSFTGFTHEIIKEYGKEPWELLKSLDAIIDGPFILKQRDLSLRYRGSRNQRLLHLEFGTGKILRTE